MNIELKQPLRTAKSRLAIVDCDIHPRASLEDLRPYLSNHWWHYIQTYGLRPRHGHVKGYPFPKPTPLASRRDSWPPGGGPPASDLDFVRTQHLDHYGIEHGVMNPLAPSGQGDQNVGLSIALASAINEWQIEDWVRREPRLKASVVVPYEDAEASVAEIRRRAGNRDFAHVLLLSRTSEALGRRRYWPIYAAAERLKLPLGIHAGSSYRHPVTALGWPSFYVEDYVAQAQGFQSQVASLISEGVFAKFPALKVVLMESGITWLPGFLWRFSKYWRGLRSEVPWVDRAPEEIVRDHFRLTLQPFDAPPDLVERTIEHLRSDDMLLYSSDFPHWQFDGDDPVPDGIPPALRRKILVENPVATYNRLKGLSSEEDVR